MRQHVISEIIKLVSITAARFNEVWTTTARPPEMSHHRTRPRSLLRFAAVRSIQPFTFFTHVFLGRVELLLISSTHCARHGAHPEQVSSPSRGHMETNEINNDDSHSPTCRDNLELLFNLTCMFLLCGREPEHPEKRQCLLYLLCQSLCRFSFLQHISITVTFDLIYSCFCSIAIQSAHTGWTFSRGNKQRLPIRKGFDARPAWLCW